MAKSGSFYKTFSTGYKLLIEWSESNVDSANNQSDITVTAKLVTNSSYYINSSASKDISLTINGTKYSSTCTVGISSGSTKTLMTKTVSNINHGSDGSKSVSISCTLGIAVTLSGTYVSSVSASGTATLTKIERESTLSASNGTLGTEQTLSVSRQSSGFTHTITYSCGSASGTIVSKSSSTSIAWTPPLSLAQQNTTGTSVSVKLTITTYNGDSVVGSSSTKTITCSIPSSVKPSVSISVSDPNGYADTYGGYVKGKSKIAVSITASGSQGSTIKSYSTSANGSTYTGSSVTTDFVKNSGELTVKTTVTDSRGRTATASKTITVLAYSDPVISEIKSYRSDENGVSNNSGTYITVQFSASVTSLGGNNTAEYVLRHKKGSSTTWTVVALNDFSGSYSPTNAKYTFSADSTSSFDIKLTVTDAFKDVTKTTTGSSASKLFSLLDKLKGKGIALGKIAELADYFDIAFKTLFRESVVFINTKVIYGTRPDGTMASAFSPSNVNGDTVVGYGNYDNKNGDTLIYGHDVRIGVSNVEEAGNYIPYYRKGMSVSMTLITAGFVTNSGKDVYFWIPLSKPMFGNPTVTLSSGLGFILRNGGNYTHGSGASENVKPDSYYVYAYQNGLYVKASFTNTTNVVNNDAIGIQWNGTVTFS